MDIPGLILVGLAIAIGLVGIVVAAIPGLILVWGAVAVWALVEETPLAWVVLAIATMLTIGGQIVKYTVPGRRLRDAGIPKRSLLLGAVLGLIGFFVVPIVGLVIGFVFGVYLAERLRVKDHRVAWGGTKHAIKAAGLSIAIEMTAGLLIAGLWLIAALMLT
jgi:uncharacterized protein YqgC (DUF456 family)